MLNINIFQCLAYVYLNLNNMKKGLAILAVALILCSAIFTSCNTRQLCPAYTENNEEVELNEAEA